MTFAEVRMIFAKTAYFCTGCHNGSGGMLPGAMNVNMHAHLMADSIQCMDKGMPRKRVVPGKAADSYLIHKLKGEMLCDGKKMPLVGGAGMTEADLKKVEDWINGGAPMN